MPTRLHDSTLSVADERRWNRTAAIIAVAACCACVGALATWGSGGAIGATQALAIVLVDGVPAAALPLLWLASAFGWGHALVTRCAPLSGRASRTTPAPPAPPALWLIVGVAAQLVVVATLGRVGVLDAFGGAVAWVVLVAPITWLVVNRRSIMAGGAEHGRRGSAWPHWILATTAPVVAIGLIASLSAPGWLWASEFGGYDAMSYHLQLPREWLAAGAISGIEHNVYSFMPGYGEAAYYHLMILVGDDVAAFTAAQMLHLTIGLATAWALARGVVQWGRSVNAGTQHAVGATAAVLFITTPWVIVVGSLAYNDLFVLLMLVGAIGMLGQRGMSPAVRGGLIGLLCAAACGAKLTAVGFVVAPITLLILLRRPRSQWIATLGAAALVGMLGLSPWLIGNLVQTGNPVFPFLTQIFGTGHWSIEQAAIWAGAHASDAQLHERFAAVWNQWLRFGIGANPQPGEPWLAQWSILPWLGVAGMIALVTMRTYGKRAQRAGRDLMIVLAVQLGFWMAATHLQSRFLLPTAIPLAVAGALALQPFLSVMLRTTPRRCALAALLLALSVPAVVVYMQQRDGAPARMLGASDAFAGRTLDPAERRDLAEILPHMYVSFVLSNDARVLLVGEAAPLYYDLDRIAYQTTWDRGPLSEVIAAHPDEPAEWPQHLAARGFTHVLIRPDMLDLWQRDGWGDSRLDLAILLAAFDAHAEPIRAYESGVRLYALPASATNSD